VRTVYFGSSEFGAAVLARLVAGGRQPQLVVTRPPKPKGRGRKPAPTPVAAFAREAGIEVFEPERVNSPEARERIAQAKPDLLLVCAYGALIKEELLSAYPLILNVHPSLLPRWRGAAPIERAIEAGDRYTGVCVMRLTAGLDSGPVCLRGVEEIGPDDDYGTLSARLQERGGGLLLTALERIDGGEELSFRDQPEQGVTYAEKIGPADRQLTADLSVDAAARKVRALRPHIGAQLPLPDGTVLGVVRAAVWGPPPDRPPGTVFAEAGRLFLALGDGTLELLEVKPAGGRAMSGDDYLRGHKLPQT
jgi:methionyl-tRNA formyltransferase